MTLIRLYHWTTAEAAEATLRDGFTDRSVGEAEPSGVWMSCPPHEAVALGSKAERLLEIVVPAFLVHDYAVQVMEGNGPQLCGGSHLEWVIPAPVLNQWVHHHQHHRGTVSSGRLVDLGTPSDVAGHIGQGIRDLP